MNDHSIGRDTKQVLMWAYTIFPSSVKASKEKPICIKATQFVFLTTTLTWVKKCLRRLSSSYLRLSFSHY